MNWSLIEDSETLERIKEESHQQKVLIYKHSTQCSISSMAKNRLEREWSIAEMGDVKPYYLDLIRYRPLSNQIAEDFGVMHESPQVLVIDKGACTYHDSHFNINYQSIKNELVQA